MWTVRLHRAVALVLSLVAVYAVPHPLAAQRLHHPRKLVREQVEDLDQQWQQAMQTGDSVTMDKLLSDDFLGITMNGELKTKAQELDRLRARDLKFQTFVVEDRKIKVVGQVAIVTSVVNVQGTSSTRPIDGSFRSTRIYQRVGATKGGKPTLGQWKITSFEVTRIAHPHDATLDAH